MEKPISQIDSDQPIIGPKRLTLAAVIQEKIFEAETLREPHWMRDSKRFSYLDKASNSDISTIWMYDIETGSRSELMNAKSLEIKPDTKAVVKAPDAVDDSEDDTDSDSSNKSSALKIIGYQWSPDETQLLLARLPHRRSSTPDSSLYLYTPTTKELKKITNKPGAYRNAKWSPDGTMIGYVHEDDLYILMVQSGAELRLTNTANPTLYNGRFGWVYEEELDIVDGWSFSPDSKLVSFFQTDESCVPVVLLPNYDDLHMKPLETRYPKAGDPNPVIKIGLIDLSHLSKQPHSASHGKQPIATTHWVDLGSDKDIYITQMHWSPKGALLLQRMNRLQNQIDLLHADTHTGSTRIVFTEKDDRWLDVPANPLFIPDSNQFLWHSDRDGHTHLYLYDVQQGMLRQLTEGDWDVDHAEGVDAAHRVAFFTAARPNPLERQLFSVLLDGGGSIQMVSLEAGTHSALFSPDCEHYLGTFSSRSSAPKVRLHRASGRSIADIHDNPMPKLEGHRTGDWEFQTFSAKDGTSIQAAILKPADFDPKKKYPVLMYTYGGPGSQVVLDTYGNGSGLEHYLAQKGILFAMVDGRGSGFRGREFKKCTYLNLGELEVNDQIDGAKWLGSLPYVDAKKIGIWGWSYGGYMASLCILRGAKVFKSAAAVAPVTDWELYDTIYAERYLRKPKDNPKGYKSSSPMTHVMKLRGDFLLAHGMADDNVHFQNTARLAAALQKEDRTFRMMAYPGKHHGMEGVSSHINRLITDFFDETLLKA